MTYSEYIKQKIINLYLSQQKIGKQSVIEKDFNFLNKYFSSNIEPNVFRISELLQQIIVFYKKNNSIQTKIGLDFLNSLIYHRTQANIFLKQTPLLLPQITEYQKQELQDKYTKVANKYGLQEFYYTLNPNLSPQENFDKAIILLDKTTLELEKIQNSLSIKKSYQIGNHILSIQVNWQEEQQNEGYYNYCSNTICLKDEKSTFPLIHEYVHFVDKTTTCLLLTGQTSQQLYEAELFSQKELYNKFDMSIFSKIEFNKQNFPWFDILKLKLLFKEQIKQTQYINKTFSNFNSKKDYKTEFKDILFCWIEEKNYVHKNLLKKDIIQLLNNKSTSVNLEYRNYSNDEQEIIIKTLAFNTFDLNMNNSKNWATEFDVRMNKPYYSTQKEMLARTIEKSIQGELKQLSDRLTTPDLSLNEKTNFYNTIKIWQQISQDIINYETNKNQKNVANKIQKIRTSLTKKPELISHFKLKY